MKPVLFTLVALMTVIPFLFMLPLGLSRRGKIVALVVSLLLSLLAVMAKSVFPLWQLGLLLLLLAMAMTYLLDRQLGHVLYAAAKEEEDEDDYDPFLFHVQNETNAAAEEQEVVPRHDDVILPTESMVPVEEQPSIEPLEKEEILKEPLLSNDETNAELLENDDDIQFLEHRFELLDDIVKDETKQEKHDSFAGEEPFFVEAEAASLLEVDEIEDKAFPEQEMMEPLPNDEWLSEWHPVDEQAEEAMAVEALPDIEIVQHTAAGNKSPLQKQLLHTVITELQLSRKHLEKAEYERCIHQCLHPHLPDDDYYAFARLLIEHYLLEKDHDKLALWLAHLQEKFAHYPILLKEIQFLHHTLMKS
ncbi:hypothetical protein [Thermaerobacillus caldiproteolyticus]|uniref:Uncharacterized protein n=1 Tax=Thermaerobacillus caldiproteolyticus TaxID=247480 RepID=A0A7W0BYP4_9BACL|nr:hypothetical protein [Anoxybacillus caldiproteolyticus]MBA2873671.1 hypothetical protein [Anoxybacillus caldiproteolyticus]